MHHRKSHRHKKLLLSFILLLVIATYVGWALLRPLGSFQPITANIPAVKIPQKLTWPVTGQSAVGIVGTDILETSSPQVSAPIASAAKIITALMVLEAKPLKAGEQGPIITLTAADVASYNTYAANDGSVVPVQVGEQISEYQALQALMLPSANNMADTLATWAYGSLPAYAEAATAFLTTHKLTGTHIGTDASGLAPSTTSTAHDLVVLGTLAMQNPALSEIVGQSTADNIPVAGTIRNVNFLLGSHNIIGVKTGNTEEAGGVYVSASTATVDGKPVTIITAIIGAPTLFAAMSNSLPLIDTAQANFQPASLVKAGAVVGHYKTPWGSEVEAIAGSSSPQATWGGTTISPSVKLKSINLSTSTTETIGTVEAPAIGIDHQQSISVKLNGPLAKPTLKWRLTHPF